MSKKYLLTIGLVLIIISSGLVGCTCSSTSGGELASDLFIDTNSQQKGVWVNGHGEVIVAPDITILQLGVSALRQSVAEAQTEAAESMNKIMAALQENGVADNDIQTQQFSIQQVTKWDSDKQDEVIVGYRVTNVVTAKIHEVANTGSIIDAVIEAGGDLTRINSISFSIDDPTEYRKDARDKAIADAKSKADQMATLTGITLGKPIYISESISYPYRVEGIGISEGASVKETPISPGDLKLNIDVQIVYTILE
ncbi:MAG: SIMPL domain-containing protein [Dehalococcoidales bacterium]|nr:SIMPL domain-containing protein [Dehalococcoidales bacterium]